MSSLPFKTHKELYIETKTEKERKDKNIAIMITKHGHGYIYIHGKRGGMRTFYIHLYSDPPKKEKEEEKN